MQRWQIILSLVTFCGWQPVVWSQQFSPPAATSPYLPPPTSPGPTAAPAYLQPSPSLIQSAPPVMTVHPAPTATTVVPLPSQTPGSIFGPPLVAPVAGAPGPGAVPVGAAIVPPAMPTSPLADIAPGGLVSPQFGLPAGPDALSGAGSVITVPVVDEQLAWDQIADVVSDYFTIAREQQARRGDVPCEGRIVTAPQSGATWLEPQRRDSVGEFNRWESTFQTIRRRALVRVIPDPSGYLVEVVVEKELEDMPSPEQATAGASVFRSDGSLPSRRADRVGAMRSSPRWISLGRDVALEQRMLADIHARLTGITSAANPSLWR